jgi:hypothetical protein
MGEPLWLSGKAVKRENKWNREAPGSLPTPGNLLKMVFEHVPSLAHFPKPLRLNLTQQNNLNLVLSFIKNLGVCWFPTLTMLVIFWCRLCWLNATIGMTRGSQMWHFVLQSPKTLRLDWVAPTPQSSHWRCLIL